MSLICVLSVSSALKNEKDNHSALTEDNQVFRSRLKNDV